MKVVMIPQTHGYDLIMVAETPEEAVACPDLFLEQAGEYLHPGGASVPVAGTVTVAEDPQAARERLLAACPAVTVTADVGAP